MIPSWLVSPPLDGPPTGGTLYNRELVRALAKDGGSLEPISLFRARSALAGGLSGIYVVDTLFLEDVPSLAERRGAARIVLLAHYLPSLVERGDAWSPLHLTSAEKAALGAIDAALAPSPFMADVLRRSVSRDLPIAVVAPGIDVAVDAPPGRSRDDGVVRALLVANAVPGKGLLPFFRALAPRLRESPRLRIDLVTNFEMDPGYGAACRDIVASEALRDVVRVVAPASRRALLELVTEADVFVSASRMESFGMAVAEARAAGTPTLARAGGNLGSLVEEGAGGTLFDDDDALASALVGLAERPDELHARRERALENRLVRSWADAAKDFNAALGVLA